jgi:hypothetical protein
MGMNSEFTTEQEEFKKEKYNVFRDYSPVKQLDVKTFNAKNRYGEYRFTEADGMEVKQRVNDEFPSGKVSGYVEYREYPNSAYEFYSEYDEKGLLIHSLTTFYNIEFGTIHYYDNRDNISKKNYLEDHYTFSIDDLIDKMKEEYDHDLLNIKNGYAIRWLEPQLSEIPLYQVHAFIDTTFMNVYLINGNTGETMFVTQRTIWYTGDFYEMPALEEYLNSLTNH